MPFVKRFRFFHFATLWCGVAINYCCNRLIYWLFSATSLINQWFELANKRHTIQPLHVLLYRTVQHPQQSTSIFALLHSLSSLTFSVLIMNDELLKRLAEKRGSFVRAAPRTANTSAPLNYRSLPAEVEAWLNSKGFSQELSEHYLRKHSFKHHYHCYYYTTYPAHIYFMRNLWNFTAPFSPNSV